MNAENINNEVKNGKAVLIDVREPFEVLMGTLMSSINIPLGEILNPQNINKIKSLSENKKVYLFCQSGNRSGQAEFLLRREGIQSENIGGYPLLKTSGVK